MTLLLTIRKTIIKYVKRFEWPLMALLKFFTGLYVFSYVGGIGLYSPLAEKLLTGASAPFLTLLLTIGFAIAPTTLAYGLLAGYAVLNTSASLEVCAFIALTCFMVIVFYIRLAPKAAWLFLAYIIAYKFNMHYAVVLFGGLYIGAAAAAPAALGSWAVAVMPNMLDMARGESVLGDLSAGLSGINVAAVSEGAVASMNGFVAVLFGSGSQAWVASAFIFAVIIIGMRAAAFAPISYAKEIALGFGMLAIVVCFIAAGAVMGETASIGEVVAGSLLSLLAVAFLRLFDSLPDYSAAERVMFEDEDNIYYVKVVPKFGE